MKQKFNPTTKIDAGVFTLYVNGLMHLRFDVKNLLAFHSYKDSNSSYGIDVYLNGEAIVSLEYDTKEKWQAVLKELDKLIV